MQTTLSLRVTDMKTKLSLMCGALAGPLFTLAWFLQGLNRADYDPLRHPISSLSIGASGWIQNMSFIITGLLTLALASGLRRALQSRGGSKWGVIWIAAVGVGFIGAGLFVTDPLNGYPPGTPLMPLQPSIGGRLHRLFSAFVFFGLPGASFVLARLFARHGELVWATYSRLSGVAFIVAFILTSAGFGQFGVLVNYAGLLQRLTLLIGLAWMTFLPLYLMNSSGRETTNRQ